MSQVFSADSVKLQGNITVPTTTLTTVVTGNFLNPPFGNAKAMVIGSVELTSGTGTTSVNVNIVRNPSAENLTVVTMFNMNVTAGNSASYCITGADVIADGRPVQYALSVVQNGATANGNAFSATISALLISG